MTIVAHVPPSQIEQILDPNTQTVINLLQKFRIPVRIVGGAVRDMLLHKHPRDVDLVVDADPSTIIYIFDSHDIPVDYGGIIHGTVKAVFGHGSSEQKVDVSSLGYRIKRHGEHLYAEGTHSWKTDAQLRDLTINSMSMDMAGNIYDYLGGVEDLQNQTVKLGPNSEVAFKMDPTSMMRYFKAISTFSNPKIRTQDLKFIQQHAHLLAHVADDKKTQMNWITILKSPHREKTINLMCKLGVHKYLDFIMCAN